MKTTKQDIVSWAGFMLFATSAVIIGVTLPEISNTFSTNLSKEAAIQSNFAQCAWTQEDFVSWHKPGEWYIMLPPVSRI